MDEVFADSKFLVNGVHKIGAVSCLSGPALSPGGAPGRPMQLSVAPSPPCSTPFALLTKCPPASMQTAESLVELVKAVMWAAGNVAAAARSGENTGTAELCLVSICRFVSLAMSFSG